MKIGLTTSTALHVALIGFGLFSLSAPAPHQSASVESFPIDIVPISEFSQSVQGERDAPLREQSAPAPTTETAEVENAENIGNAAVDQPTPPTPEPRPRPVETAAAPPPAEEPAPEPTPEPEPAPPPPEPAPAEAAEAPPEPQPAEPAEAEVAPEPEPAPTETPRPEFAELPDRMLAPPTRAERPRPRPEPAQTQTPERQPEQPRREETASTERDDEQFDADQIAALLNRDTPSGGGAQRSSQEAALGGRQTTGATLSQNEIDSLRSQVSRCWNPPVGAAEAENLVVSVRIRLSPSGELEGNPEVVSGGGASMAERAAADAARRAILRCQPYNAPADKYEAWADVQFNFDPRDMF